AAIVMVAVATGATQAQALLMEAADAWRSAPRDLATLAAVAYLVGLERAILPMAKRIETDVAALTALAQTQIVAGEGAAALKLVSLIAPNLPHNELTRLRSFAERARREEITLPGVPNPEEAARELDRALMPEFSIIDFLRSDQGLDHALDLDADLRQE